MFDRKGKHFCSSSGTHRGTLVKDPMINHAKGQELYYNIQNKNVRFKFSAHNAFLNIIVVICDREDT
jgi:hypothetical protein